MILIHIAQFPWSLLTALMATELSTLTPDEGGYYVPVCKTTGGFRG
jgi:hypothetical protein